MKKKHNGSRLVALLLAALVVTSSSALVYAADTDTFRYDGACTRILFGRMC